MILVDDIVDCIKTERCYVSFMNFARLDLRSLVKYHINIYQSHLLINLRAAYVLSFTLVLARHRQGSPRSLLNKPAQGRNYIHHWRKDNLCGWNSVRIWAGKWSERNDLKREFSFRGILSPWPYLFFIL